MAIGREEEGCYSGVLRHQNPVQSAHVTFPNIHPGTQGSSGLPDLSDSFPAAAQPQVKLIIGFVASNHLHQPDHQTVHWNIIKLTICSLSAPKISHFLHQARLSTIVNGSNDGMEPDKFIESFYPEQVGTQKGLFSKNLHSLVFCHK